MQAIIFDLDGTLLDVRESFYWQFQELTKQFDGAPVSRAMIDLAAQVTTEQAVRSLVRNNKVPFDEVLSRHHDIRVEAYNRYVRPYRGVEELLPILKRMGVKLAVLTSDEGLSAAYMKHIGLHDHFDVVITTDQFTHPKPHPESIDLVIEKLGISPDEAVLVGDMVADILVGKNAGLKKTIGIAHGFDKPEALHKAGADHVVHDIPSILDVLE